MAKKPVSVETLKHTEAARPNIPTAEFESLMDEAQKSPVRVAYERRNRDLDPQLVWRGKDEQDAAGLTVPAPPLYIQEKVHPKALIEALRQETKARAAQAEPMADMFADFNGLPDLEAKTEFYQHPLHWSNRMILGDSLYAMASLAEREGLRGKVQCIYFDPPYGIKFNSNFQWSTTSRDVKDGAKDHVTREPEQVRAFRDTWRDGIHSYLSYLRDRLTVARDLLTESGSIFVQIGDENVHRVRAVMDEVFGEENFVSQITFKKSSSATDRYISSTSDYLIWFSKNIDSLKYRPIKNTRVAGGSGGEAYRLHEYLPGHWRSLDSAEMDLASKQPELFKILRLQVLTSQRQGRDTGPAGAMSFPVNFNGKMYLPTRGRGWTTTSEGIARLIKANRVGKSGESINYKRYFDDARSFPIYNIWDDTQSGSGMDKTYVVQTATKVIERCILMSTDPGDLVLDPTCGSGTTAYVAEQWGRRWITLDTSRVALALARSRLMGARYPYYLLADSPEGRKKEAEITRTLPRSAPTYGDIRQGFVYERVPHITLKSIANNAEIDVIWQRWQETLEPLRAALNAALGKAWEEWEIPRAVEPQWSAEAQKLHADWWAARIARQQEIDASIAAKADVEYLYDKPYADSGRVRVAGPFTVESLSPHRTLAVDADDSLFDILDASEGRRRKTSHEAQNFVEMIMENLRTAGVQQAHKEDRIHFTSLRPWPGKMICAEGVFLEGEVERRAGILIGPEFGSIVRENLMSAAREAGDAGFDLVIACAFSFDAHSAEVEKLGRIRILKARMNPDLHMGGDLKPSATANLFVIFGEPDIQILPEADGRIRVKIKGLDVFKPQIGKVEPSEVDDIALWMIDTSYNEESFFVRHAYFLGANDPYKALKTTLKAEIDAEAWASLKSDTSRPFDKPETGRIAVKVINHLGDEVMKVFDVG